jgi:hypothetical protein
VLQAVCGTQRDRVATADRDGKVRLSHFPHTNVILAYCLGHEE